MTKASPAADAGCAPCCGWLRAQPLHDDITVDLNNLLKGRIAEALVESIFLRVRYQVARVGRESHLERLMKVGADGFAPDFFIWKPVPGKDGAADLHQFLAVEVKYRADLAEFLRRDGVERFSEAKGQWPDLYFVFVTDRTDAGRSCFQAVCLRDYMPGKAPTTRDLHDFPALGIPQALVKDYEDTATGLFATLVERMPPRRATWPRAAAQSVRA